MKDVETNSAHAQALSIDGGGEVGGRESRGGAMTLPTPTTSSSCRLDEKE